MGAHGLPVMSAVTPVAFSIAATIEPPPGMGPSGVGYVGS